MNSTGQGVKSYPASMGDRGSVGGSVKGVGPNSYRTPKDVNDYINSYKSENQRVSIEIDSSPEKSYREQSFREQINQAFSKKSDSIS